MERSANSQSPLRSEIIIGSGSASELKGPSVGRDKP